MRTGQFRSSFGGVVLRGLGAVNPVKHGVLMADEHAPVPSPHSKSGFSASPPPTEMSNGTPSRATEIVPASDGQAPAKKEPSGHLPEFVQFLRWIVGLLIVGVCGWGLIGLAFWLCRSRVQHIEWVLGIVAALDLGLFLFLEKRFWLSRFMGLGVEPNTHAWHSAVLLWLLGVPGLLFRSTELRPQTEALAQPAGQPRTRPQPVQHSDSVREIVETVVFVVVLVLLLKSFAAEAFVIPTGSMAQTLLGYQKEVVCPDCGIHFPINCSQEVDPNEGKPSAVYACVCPNCRQHIHFPMPRSPIRATSPIPS